MEVIHVMMLALFFKSIMQYGGFFLYLFLII